MLHLININTYPSEFIENLCRWCCSFNEDTAETAASTIRLHLFMSLLYLFSSQLLPTRRYYLFHPKQLSISEIYLYIYADKIHTYIHTYIDQLMIGPENATVHVQGQCMVLSLYINGIRQVYCGASCIGLMNCQCSISK